VIDHPIQLDDESHRALWDACLDDGWSFPDETVETVVRRFVDRTGWPADRVLRYLERELAQRGESLASARALFRGRRPS